MFLLRKRLGTCIKVASVFCYFTQKTEPIVKTGSSRSCPDLLTTHVRMTPAEKVKKFNRFR